MNVVCVRCNTRYEFDDALVSARGTSVKCTNCGHKFRVHPPGGRSASLPDQWVIRKRGTQVASVRFETLRDLQRALNEGSVTIADEISRDGASFRPIHAVPELESFFPKQARAPQTPAGMEKPPPASPRAGADFEEDEATAVYTSEQLDGLRPGRSATPAGTPRPAARPAVATPAVPASVRKPAAPAGTPARPATSGPPAAPVRPKVALPATGQKSLAPVAKISGSPIVSPRGSAAAPGMPLPGTRTIAVTGSSNTDASLDFDTVRPPPADAAKPEAALAGRAALPSVPPEDVPTRVGKAESFGKHTMLGVAPPAMGAAPPPMPGSIKPLPPHSPTPPGGTLAVPAPAFAATALAPGHSVGPAPSASVGAPVASSSSASVTPAPHAAPGPFGVAAPAVPGPPANAPRINAPALPTETLPSEVALAAGGVGSDPPGLRRRGRRGSEVTADVPPLPRHDAASTASAFEALDREPSLAPRQRGNLRWVFGILLVAGIAGVALLFGREHLGSQPAASTSYEAELEVLLASGHDLYRQGDLEGASSQFDKASGLSASDPRVLAATLLVETTRCDRSWLEQRLWPDGSADATTAAAALTACGTKLTALSERALQASDGTPEFRAALLDSFRIRGELAHARARAGGLAEHASNPVAAYALAMLDVADESPSWPSVIDRLRLASGGEPVPARAHAALVYALVRSGDREAARSQLQLLESAARPYVLLPALKAFVGPKDADDAASAAPVPSEAPTTVGAAPGEPGTAPGIDPLEGARQARAKGDFGLAERYYQEALQKDPANVAALTGLGDVSRGRGNSAAAISHYQAALRVNPQHLPAISGVADVNWANGDRAEAVRYYKRIGDGNSFSIRAQQRIAEFEGSNSQPAPAPSEPGGREPGGSEGASSDSAPSPEAPEHEGQGDPSGETPSEAEPEPVPIPKPPVEEEPTESDPPRIPGPAPKDER